MTPDRMDTLLDQTLETGTMPAEATPEERAELERMLAGTDTLRLNASEIRAEADRAMPTARARFQRHLASQQERRTLTPPLKKRRSLFGILGGGMLTYASTAAALAVVAVLAVIILQPFSNPDTASALEVDDYVQVQGVVAATGDGTVTVQSSELGNLEIALTDLTAVSDRNGTRDPASLQPGVPVLVSGVVTATRTISASNVALSEVQDVPTPVGETKLPLLKQFRPGLLGTISLFTLSPDGKRARVVLVTRNERLLVEIDARSMEQFLVDHPNAVGAVVRVVEAPDLPGAVFRLAPADAPPPNPTPPTANPATPQFENVRGVVVGRALNVLMVRTDRGVVPVVLRPLTSIRFGDSGLTPQEIRDGESVIGYEVVITGNPEEGSGRRVIASILVVVGKSER